MFRLWHFAVLLAALVSLGCAPRDARTPPTGTAVSRAHGDQPTVVVDNYPLGFLVDQIAGDAVRVWFPIDDANPRTWTPPDEMVGEIQGADLIVVQGGNYAGWVERISLPPAKVLNVGDGLPLGEFIVVQDYTVHRHGPEGEHSHSGMVPTTWLDPALFARQSQIVLERLVAQWPDQREAFERNRERLAQSLAEFEQEMDRMRADQPVTVLTSVPDYKYLTRRLNIDDAHGHLPRWPTSPESLEDQLEKLDQRLAEHPTTWMIWHIDPGDEARQALDQRGLNVVIVPLLERAPEQGDFLTAMRSSLERLRETVLSGASAQPPGEPAGVGAP